MAAFAMLFALVVLRTDPAISVLSVARPVAAGQVITEADLTVARVVPAAGVDVVTDADRSAVVGRTATVPLLPGTLLAPAQIGDAAWPPAGEAVVAIPVPAGRLPSGLANGARVGVLVPPETEDLADGGPGVVAATVVTVEAPSAAGVVTVSLLLPRTQAQAVAAAGDGAVLILESPGAGG